MVFFTCNACGQAIKKAQVEKHYLTQCRNCEVLSCIDCGKDFYGDDYKQHTQCISENEKYGGKDYQAPNKANKGEAKQEQWLQRVRESCKGGDIGPNVRNLLERVAEYPNVPRKKSKFENFLRNSLKLHNPKVMEQIWSVFSAASGKQETPSKTPPSSCKPSESDASSLVQGEEGGVEEKLPNIESTTEDPPQGQKTKQNKRKKLKEEADDSNDDLDSTVAPEGLDVTATGDRTSQENAKRTKSKSKKEKIREENEAADLLKSHDTSGSVEGSFEHVKEKKKSKKKESTEKSDVLETTVKDCVPSVACISTDSSCGTERGHSAESGGREKKTKREKQCDTDKQIHVVATDVSSLKQKQDQAALAHCRNHESPETEIGSASHEKKRKKKAKGKCGENHSDGDGKTHPKSDLAVYVEPTATVRKKTKKGKSDSDDVTKEKKSKENSPSKAKDVKRRGRKSVDGAPSVAIDSGSVDAKTDSDSSKKVDGKKKKKAKSAKGTNKVKSATETESNTLTIVGSVVSALPDTPKRRKRKLKSSDTVPEIALKKTKKKKVDLIHMPPNPSDIVVTSPGTDGAVGSEGSASGGRVKSKKKKGGIDMKAELILSDKEKVKKKKNWKQEEVAAFNASPEKLDAVGRTGGVKKKVKKSKKPIGKNVSKGKTEGGGQGTAETTGLQTKKKAKKANYSERVCEKCMSILKVASPKQNGDTELGQSGGSVKKVKKRKRKHSDVASPEIAQLNKHVESSPQGEPSNKKCKKTKSVKKNDAAHPDDKESDHVHGKVGKKENRESHGAAVTDDAKLEGTETDHVQKKVKKKKKNLGKLNENMSDNTKGEDKESDRAPKNVKKKKNREKRGKTIIDDAGDNDLGTEDARVSLSGAALNGTVAASQKPKKAKKVKKVKVKIISSSISKKFKKGGKEKTSATRVKKVKISRKKVGDTSS